jgi:1,4-dihydroxy-2-naphthoate octaprenyltransferase
MFGRNSATAVAPDETPADERTEPIDSDHADRRAAVDDTEPVVDDTEPVIESEPTAKESVVERESAQSKRWAHVSLLASLTLVIGTLSVAATLTGLLAPIGFATGVLAVILGALATYSIGRPNVTGHGLVTCGVLFGVISIVLSLLAINGQLSWLSSDTNEVTTVHNWLNHNMHWLRRW